MLYTKFRLEDCISALATGEENPYVICKRSQVINNVYLWDIEKLGAY